MSRPLFRRVLAAGTGVVAAVAVGVLAAPPAAATTTTSCQDGFTNGSTYDPIGFFNCSGFADHGAPYVFHVANLLVWYPPPLISFNFPNVTESCASFKPDHSMIDGYNCQAVR